MYVFILCPLMDVHKYLSLMEQHSCACVAVINWYARGGRAICMGRGITI